MYVDTKFHNLLKMKLAKTHGQKIVVGNYQFDMVLGNVICYI